jgi:phospholipid/cholesterol/gamma-HCH transport system ATP-binding protein
LEPAVGEYYVAPHNCSACGATLDDVSAARFCPRCGAALIAPRHVVQLAGIWKSFSGNQVLRDVDLSVPAGESLVVVGMSGSGKSVLLEHIIGFQRPDCGRVIINGVELAAGHENERTRRLRKGLSLVFQGAALIDSLTVVENVMLPLVGRGIADADARQHAIKYLAAVGLSEAEGHLYSRQLSGGMQKRVGIARALVTNPDIILYDEPTTGLDSATSGSISRLMREVHQSRPGMTSITITHDYLSAGIIGDRVVFLDANEGRLTDVLGRGEFEGVRQEFGEHDARSVQRIRQRLEEFFGDLELIRRSHSRTGDVTSWGGALLDVLTSAFHTLGAATLLLRDALHPPELQALLRMMWEIGYKSLLMTSLTGFFLGMMLAVQIALALDSYSAFELLPGIIGMILVDKVGPLFVGLLLAGRIGASVAADIGGKRLSRQFDALRSMAISPERYWLVPMFWASVVCLPMLAITLEVCGFLGAYSVATARGYVPGPLFLDRMFERTGSVEFAIGLMRTAIYGGAIALVAYSQGAGDIRSSEEVGRATTTSVVAASIAVIGLDFVLTMLTSFG